MSIIFDEIAHTYTDDQTGERLPGVNEIINAVYGSGYEYVKKDILNARAERGKEIHKEAQELMNTSEYCAPKHTETVALIQWFEENDIYLAEVETEKIVCVRGMFAGTADLITGQTRLWDYKTNLNKPTKKMLAHWQKQLSMYKFALDLMGYEIGKMTVLHLSGTKCTPYDLEYLGDQWVIDTWRAFKDGRKIEEKPMAVSNVPQVSKRAISKLGRTLKKIALLEKEIEPIREQIKLEMEKRGIMALNTGEVSITYIGPTKRQTFDTNRFKAENEGLYEKYTKETEVKSQIRIKYEG